MTLTIITINYNNASGLQKTMESVLAQTCNDFEFIIVDGASTDGSVEFLEKNHSKLKTLNSKLITEPDTGIYNAMNKGIRMATGDYIHFLNSGDWLVDENVVKDVLDSIPDCDIFVGNVVQIFENGKKRYCKNVEEVSLMTFYKSTIQHTSAYIKRELFNTFGLYDESLKIVSDWKWYLQVAGLNKADVRFTERYISCFDMSGISSVNKQLDKLERRKVLEELIPKPILADYDKYSFDIIQMNRLRKHPFIYKMVWFVERVLFKLDKWRLKSDFTL